VKRTSGLVFMVVGMVGLVGCLLLLPAVWLGGAVANNQVSALAGDASVPLQQVDQTVLDLRARVEAVRARIREVADQAETAAQGGTIDQQRAQRVADLIDQTLGADYVRLRESFVAIRERVQAAMRARDRVQQLAPGRSPPTLPTEDLAALDEELQAIDASLRQMRANLSAGTLPGTDLMRRVAEGMRQLDARLAVWVTRLDAISARIDQVQVALDESVASVLRGITIAAVVLSLLCLYGALLHVALVATGRAWHRRGPDVSEPTPELANVGGSERH
jgi:division protein CdvB (Snf7/Vps24/ESCRT-III family)